MCSVNINEMTADVTSEEIRINNSIYESIVDGGIDLLKNPVAMDGEDPIELLEGSIQFFSDLDTSDGYRKCSDLLKIKQKLLSEQK